MSCEFRDNLVAYLDGELPQGEFELVRAHIEGCSDCRRHAELLKRSYDALEAVDSPEAALSLAAGVRARTRRRIVKPARVFAALAAAAVALLAVAVRFDAKVDVRPAPSEVDAIAGEIIAALETDTTDAVEFVDTFDALANVDDLDAEELYTALEAVEGIEPGVAATS